MKKEAPVAIINKNAGTRENAYSESAPVEIEILTYNTNSCSNHSATDIAGLKKLVDKNKINLIFISNLTDAASIEELGNYFSIHPMAMEDAVSLSELPTVHESGDQLLLTLKLIDFQGNGDLFSKHIGLLLGDFYVIVFKDSENKIFDEIKKRIENSKSKARQKNSDYLFYLLTDAVIDSYYNVVNELDNRIDKMEELLLEQPETNYISHLYRIKQPISEMRVVIYPIREALLNMVQGDYPLIEEETIPFLHDVKDHINNIVNMFESCRDTLSDLLEINNSNINNRLNRTMKMLTIITTFFVPLTFIAGIYGMNFKNMPEISWKYGYLMAIGVMLITSLIIYYIMKRKKLL